MSTTYPTDWPAITQRVKTQAGWQCEGFLQARARRDEETNKQPHCDRCGVMLSLCDCWDTEHHGFEKVESA
jgi:hypothetical protein